MWQSQPMAASVVMLVADSAELLVAPGGQRPASLCEKAAATAAVGSGALWGLYATSLLAKLQGTSFDRGVAEELWRCTVRAVSHVLWLLHLAGCEARAGGPEPTPDEDCKAPTKSVDVSCLSENPLCARVIDDAARLLPIPLTFALTGDEAQRSELVERLTLVKFADKWVAASLPAHERRIFSTVALKDLWDLRLAEVKRLTGIQAAKRLDTTLGQSCREAKHAMAHSDGDAAEDDYDSDFQDEAEDDSEEDAEKNEAEQSRQEDPNTGFVSATYTTSSKTVSVTTAVVSEDMPLWQGPSEGSELEGLENRLEKSATDVPH
ncbi:hypothetical protein AK812_SmicGene2496 [Symbiodinium microadriaticum]|uniref:Uncharacterized protein n=1 Tax=Symbiodinium microadriaticum TaxID=2951 RepID=A0A1Q9F172_SYMMI|nr:hypothetical protein AK812_SmicGene2496 [Symbiodinium microadriaticum]